MKKLGKRSRTRHYTPKHMMKLPPTHASYYFTQFHLNYGDFEFPEETDQESYAIVDEHGRRELHPHFEEEDELYYEEYSCAPSEMPSPKPVPYKPIPGKAKKKGHSSKKKKGSKSSKKGSKKKKKGSYRHHGGYKYDYYYTMKHARRR